MNKHVASLILVFAIVEISGCSDQQRNKHPSIILDTSIFIDQHDHSSVAESLYNALETGRTGQAFKWCNKQTGNHGIIVPGKLFLSSNKQISRRFTYIIKNQKEEKISQGISTAMRHEDGTWHVVSIDGNNKI